METRRLKLFVVAYLRGLLKPNYEHGFKSRLREEMILTALNAELDTEAMVHSLIADTAFVSSESNSSGIIDRVYDKIMKIRLRSEFEDSAKIDKIVERREAKKTKSKKGKVEKLNIGLVDMYKMLQHSGLMNKLGDMMEKVRKK